MRLFSITALLTLCSLASSTSAVLIEVPSGTYPTIASGLEAAGPDDVVELAAGTYDEYNLQVPSGVTIRGATGDPRDVVINGLAHWVIAFNTCSGNSRMEDLTVAGGAAAYSGSGVNFYNANTVVENCIIRENSCSDYGAGVYAGGAASDIEFRDCQFIDNATTTLDGAAYFGQGVGNVRFFGCVFEGNTAGRSGGGVVINGGVGELHSCTFIGNSAPQQASALSVAYGSVTMDHCLVTENFLADQNVLYYVDATITLTCCDLYNNSGEAWHLQIADQFGVDGNISEDPQFCTDPNKHLQLESDSPCGDCDGVPIGAFGAGCDDTAAESSTWSHVKAIY